MEVMKFLMHRTRRTEYYNPSSWTLMQDNALINTATFLTRFYAKNQITVLTHPPYSSDFAYADYFLF